MRYVALLRAINVGAGSRISMSELRGALEAAGIAVRHTHMQSGNVVFDAPRAPAPELAARVEAAVTPKLARATAAVVLSARELGCVLADAPAGWENDDAIFAHHLIFVIAPATAHRLLAGQQFDGDTERVTSKGRVIYWSIRKGARARGGMVRMARTPAYRHMTVRTHALVRRLHELTQTV